ncbi:MAG: nucleotide sugar dehydrogenase [Dehalococcoidia bacterium]|nr:MAG: nucleotide sugar dehydrogenase [Dehalococcoidia bacterium]
MNVAIVGLGKIGLPLAVQFASKGATVAGYDVDGARVRLINEKYNPLPAEPGLEERIPGLVVSGHLRATTDPRDAVAAADVVVFIVPVDVDATQRPDFALLDAAVDAVAPHVPRGVLLIVETTVPVGTTRRVAARVGELAGLTPGADFSAAFSPERVSSGRVLRDLATYPKIVGGIDAHSTARAADFYRAMLDATVMEVRDAETAEFSKLAETTYRDVNIALANEFARIADRLGVDALQAIEAANSQPYSHIHAPGVGVGGHCIPVYPYFLAGDDTEIIAAARRLNDDMAHYAVGRLAAAIGSLEGRTVVVLGLAYRPGVKESRHSSALALASQLAAAGATVYVHDSLYAPDEIRAHGLEPPPSFPCPAEALVIQAWHAEYESLDLRSFSGVRAILDGRGALDAAEVERLGLTYVGIGR